MADHGDKLQLESKESEEDIVYSQPPADGWEFSDFVRFVT